MSKNTTANEAPGANSANSEILNLKSQIESLKKQLDSQKPKSFEEQKKAIQEQQAKILLIDKFSKVSEKITISLKKLSEVNDDLMQDEEQNDFELILRNSAERESVFVIQNKKMLQFLCLQLKNLLNDKIDVLEKEITK